MLDWLFFCLWCTYVDTCMFIVGIVKRQCSAVQCILPKVLVLFFPLLVAMDWFLLSMESPKRELLWRFVNFEEYNWIQRSFRIFWLISKILKLLLCTTPGSGSDELWGDAGRDYFRSRWKLSPERAAGLSCVIVYLEVTVCGAHKWILGTWSYSHY